MKIINKYFKKIISSLSFVLVFSLLCSCQRVNMDFLLDNDNKDFYLPLDNKSDSQFDKNKENNERILIPIQFINLDNDEIISEESGLNDDNNDNTNESSINTNNDNEENNQTESSTLIPKSEEENETLESITPSESTNSSTHDTSNLETRSMPITNSADLKSIKGEYYDKWTDDIICQILPISDNQSLVKRALNENALKGVEVFIDAGTFSSRENYIVSYGKEQINEKDLYIDIAKMAAYSLESLGAKVIILGNDDAKDIHEFARIFTAASHIFREIKDAYLQIADQSSLFIQTIDQYLSKINTIILKNEDKGDMLINKSPRAFAQGSGANLEERYYLDLMSRLDHIVYIQLRLSTDEESKEAGYQVSYLSNKEAYRADQFNSQYYSNLDPNEYYPEHPTYQMYDDNKRKKLAKCLDLTMQQYCQSLNNNLPKRKIDWNDIYEYEDFTIEADSRASRHLNIPVVTLKLGNANNKLDSEALVKDVERYLISKAITHAIYKYFCQ